jgi:hypothetical protein
MNQEETHESSEIEYDETLKNAKIGRDDKKVIQKVTKQWNTKISQAK